MIAIQRGVQYPAQSLVGSRELRFRKTGRSSHQLADLFMRIAFDVVQPDHRSGGLRQLRQGTLQRNLLVDTRAIGTRARGVREIDVGRQLVAVRSRQRYGLHRSDGTLTAVSAGDQKIPIKMLNDRLLVKLSKEDGERTSSGGILIPATAQMAKRLVWAEVVALGQNVRSAEMGDKVLFSPDDRYEVEVGGEDYIMLRERDLHAVAAQRIEASTGLYL